MQVYDSLGLLPVLSWLLFHLARIALPRPRAVIAGVVVATLCVTVLFDSAFVAAIMAIFAPFGAVLPALALRGLWAGSGRPVRPFATAELIAVIVLILPLYASALGMLEVDLYRLGYAPLCGGAIALVLGVYAMSRRHYFVAVGVLAGQLAWSFDVTSTNIVDHIGHVVILGAAAVVLLLRLTGLALRAMRGSA